MNDLPEKRTSIRLGSELFPLHRCFVMGILNLTPDSFFDGGKFSNERESRERSEKSERGIQGSISERLVFEQVENMVAQGADFIDVGAVSTRPGAPSVSVEEEIDRLRFLGDLVKRFPDVHFSIDTYRSEVVRVAADQGVVLVNDVSAGQLDPELFSTVGQLGLPYVLMHMQGTPETMQKNPSYQNIEPVSSPILSEVLES